MMTELTEMIKAFPEQLKLALEPPVGLSNADKGTPTTSILVVGMGGSAFGAEVVRNLLNALCRVPITIVRDYSLPAFVGPSTLVILSSYSGDTEETLSALEKATAANAKIVCITGGGKIKELAQSKGIDLLLVPPGLPPRMAVGFSISRQLQILKYFGFAPDFSNDLKESISLLQSFSDQDLAREIAKNFYGHLPVIYSSAEFESASIRWRQQIEENAKQLASNHTIPEMNHNELVGWNLPHDLLGQFSVVILRSVLDHPRVKMRMDLNAEIIGNKPGSLKIVDAKGVSRLAQIMYFIHLGDWVSMYLAELNVVEPIPVNVIQFLKSELEKK